MPRERVAHDVDCASESGRHAVATTLMAVTTSPSTQQPHLHLTFLDLQNIMLEEQPGQQGERVPHPLLHDDFDLLRSSAHQQGHFATSTFGIAPPSFFQPVQISPAGVPVFRSRYSQPPPKPTRYSHPGYPFLAPPAQMALPKLPFADVFGHNISQGRTDGNQNNTQKGFDPARQATPQLEGRPMWPNYPPGVPHPLQMYSRLPPNSVARKAPRKSVVSTTATNSPNLPTRSARPAQRRGSKQEYREKHKIDPRAQTRQDSRNDTPALDQEARFEQEKTRHDGPQGPPRVPARSRPLVLDDDDEHDDGDEQTPIDSIEEDSASDEDLHFASTTPARTTRGQFRANLPARQRQSPRYQYTVPKGLQGVQRALGEDNWNEYVILAEKRLLGEMTEMEFIKSSKAIFLVFDEETSYKIERQIANKMVMPVITEHHGGATSG